MHRLARLVAAARDSLRERAEGPTDSSMPSQSGPGDFRVIETRNVAPDRVETIFNAAVLPVGIA